MLELSKKIKLEILRVILTESDVFGTPSDSENIIKFIDNIFDLRTSPSQDARFRDAYGDAYQHLVNNDDWSYEYFLTERFNIIDNTEIFIDFLQRIISPNHRKDEDDIMKYYLLINPYLEKEKSTLIIIDYDEDGLPIYEVKTLEEVRGIPTGLKQNNIPFFVDNKPTGFFENINSHITPTEFPSFVLALNYGWNDYSIVSTYALFCYQNIHEGQLIGVVKIIHKENLKTFEEMPLYFKTLDDNFCSLGQDISYYENLKNVSGKNFDSIAWVIKDAAIFNDIHEIFENNTNFRNSLIRYDEQERLLREVKYQIYDYNLKNLYSFKYSFTPKFAEDEIEVNFDFDKRGLIPNRIFALIGKNGTGKTQLVTSLPVDIWKKRNEKFTPKAPLFSKVIAVSYSAFDNFEIPKKTADFNYVYCGLKNEKGELYTEQGLKLRFHSSWKKIKEKNRNDKWIKILSNFIHEDLMSEFIAEDGVSWEYKVDIKGFNNVSKKLSSGQSILLYIITEIVANIRLDSLVIYDEPETHLHPNAISQLVNTIYELVNEFQSYCIIATHSPLIIRDLLSKNVYIIERENNFVSIRKPYIETFGENLTVLTEEVFGNRDVSKQFKKILNGLIDNGKSYEDIISEIESDVPLSLNARIYLKSIINEKS